MSSAAVAIAVLIGYLLGSVSPAYILGKILKKIDIREHGSRNAGTLNVYRQLGLAPAIITATFDVSKGLLAMFIAHLLGANPLVIHLSGAAAILGHVFPFYLKFRGGQGVATATAILIYYFALFYVKGWLPLDTLAVLAIWVLSFIFITKVGEVEAVVVLPVVGLFVLIFAPFSQYSVYIWTVIAYILMIGLLNLKRIPWSRASAAKVQGEINWRLYLRPLAVLLTVYYMKTEKKQALTLVGSIALFFLLFDLIRLFSRQVNVFFFERVKRIYKQKELRQFSSITIFLFAFFLTVLLFEKNIALLATVFLIFGDFFSKFFGIHFGRTKIFEKTLEGSLAHFSACLLAGYILLHYISFPLHACVIGALIASASEVLPVGVNDNFSVSLLSASVMYVFQLF
jgi:glycerol-3-phosphate acyltransferase PlsY